MVLIYGKLMRVQYEDFDRECSSTSRECSSEIQAEESALSQPSAQLASIATMEGSSGPGSLGLTSRITSRTHLNTPPKQVPSQGEQPQRMSRRGERASPDENESCEVQSQSPRWNAFGSLSEEANYDPKLFIAKHFLDKRKKYKDQTKTLLPIALTGLSDPKSLARFARNRSVVVRMVPDAYTSTLILGWNGEEVKDIASNFPTKYPELCKKRKADWELSPESRRRKRNAKRQRRWQQSKVTIIDDFSDVFHRLPSDDLSPPASDSEDRC